MQPIDTTRPEFPEAQASLDPDGDRSLNAGTTQPVAAQPLKLTWQQKRDVLRGLGQPDIFASSPRQWFASVPGVYVKRANALVYLRARGKSEKEAVNNLWRQLTDGLGQTEHLIIDPHGPMRRCALWTGANWEFWLDRK